MAKARLSHQFATLVKDQVRSVQFRLRRRAKIAPNVDPGMRMIPRPVALAADVLMTQVQSAALGMLPESLRQSSNFMFPAPISAYFGPPREESREFTSEIYYAVRALVLRFSQGDCLVSEAAVEDVYARMTERHEARLQGALAGDSQETISACAALAAELASVRPIRAWVWEPSQTSSPRHFFLSPNQYVAFVIGLSIAVKSQADARQGEPLGDDDIVNLVDFAVDARFPEFSAAITSRNPAEHLTKVFAEIVPFIA